MEAQIEKLGGSLAVPNVQELADETLLTVPPRYVRDDLESPIISNLSDLPQVPIIDMHSLLTSDFVDSELQKLDFACKEWGFFQLINHGVSSPLVEKVKEEIKEFFELPKEEKIKYNQLEGDVEGYGQAFVVSEDQKLDWADLFYLVTLPHHMRKPHLFYKLPLSFRDTLEAYSTELKKLALKVLEKMAKTLRMEAEDMRVLFKEGMQSMRMNYYPPCPSPDLAIGLTPHSDPVGLTILLQLNEIDGLHVRKDGAWIPIKPLPNSFIINIGDILEIVSNGTYRSVEHRAIVNSVKERLSIATFFSPKFEGDFGPAPSLITPLSPALFTRIGVGNYFKGVLARKLNGKSYLDIMKIQTPEI